LIGVWAFLLRDFRAAWSYRFGFAVQSISLVFSIVSIKFLSDMVTPSGASSLATYGGDYFSFALIGMALTLISYPLITSFASGVRSAQVTGTFEAMLTTQTDARILVFSSGIFPLVQACLQVVATILIGSLLLGADLHLTHVLLVSTALIMTVVALSGIGLMSAAFVVAYKQNEPFSGALLAVSFLIGGVLYPTTVLPGWLSQLAPLLPITHAVELNRALLIDAMDQGAITSHFVALAVFCLLLPLGLLFLTLALDYAKRNGSLSHY
jgi:ABC-2 type transport system permease protein